MAMYSSVDNSFNCKLCLETIQGSEAFQIAECGCKFCKQCMTEYVRIGISEGNILFKCPDNQCLSDPSLSKIEIESLAPADDIDRYYQLCFEREVALDPSRAFCPLSNCASICHVPQMRLPYNTWKQNSLDMPQETPKFWKGLLKKAGTSHIAQSQAFNSFLPVVCYQCSHQFCVYCKQTWHNKFHHRPCADHYFRALNVQASSAGITSLMTSWKQDLTASNDFEGNIKRCPRCFILIERDNGCAQMRCNRCKHVFCWICLEPLNDDILLRHYDGPCNVSFGHSRASLVRHRVQVICSLIGICLLIILNSPLILFICICLLACKYIRRCFTQRKSTAGKTIELEATMDGIYRKQDDSTNRNVAQLNDLEDLSTTANLRSIVTHNDLSQGWQLSNVHPQSASTSSSIAPVQEKRQLFLFRGLKQSSNPTTIV